MRLSKAVAWIQKICPNSYTRNTPIFKKKKKKLEGKQINYQRGLKRSDK